MALKPQDVVVALKIALGGRGDWTYAGLAHELALSASEVHGAVRRAGEAGLLLPDRRHPNRTALLEFLVHGLKYAFAPHRGPLTRGMPTAHAARPLSDEFRDQEPPPVWPAVDGTVRGEQFDPLYPSAPKAAQIDPKLYEALALVDAIRGGRARERQRATELLEERLRAR